LTFCRWASVGAFFARIPQCRTPHLWFVFGLIFFESPVIFDGCDIGFLSYVVLSQSRRTLRPSSVQIPLMCPPFGCMAITVCLDGPRSHVLLFLLLMARGDFLIPAHFVFPLIFSSGVFSVCGNGVRFTTVCPITQSIHPLPFMIEPGAWTGSLENLCSVILVC